MTDDLLDALGRDLRGRSDRVERGDAPPELLEPLTPGQREAVLDAAFEQLGRRAEDHSEDDQDEDDEDEGDDVPESAAVVSLSERAPSTRPKVMVALLAGVMAVAAAVLLWSMSSRTKPDPELIAALPLPLPSYAVTSLVAGDSTSRAGDGGAPPAVQLRPSDRLRIVLTPAEPVREAVGVVIVARPADGSAPTLVRPSSGVTISQNGAVLLQGSLDELLSLAPGTWTLDLLVGPVASLPETASAVRDASEPAWQTVEVQLTVVEPRSR